MFDMNQGTFLHNQSTFELTSNAGATGTHTLIVSLYGGAVVSGTFSASSGSPFVVPNIFPEIGTYKFRIIDPSNTEFDDGSGCAMELNVELDSC